MKTSRITSLLLAGALAIALPVASLTLGVDTAQAQQKAAKKGAVDQAKIKDIRRLLVLTGSGKMAIQSLSMMVSQFKRSMPNVPTEFWDEFLKEVKEDELIDLIVPIYSKHYSHSEVKKLIAFYESPIGKKSIAVMPQIVQESQVAGQQWGMQLAKRIQVKLEKKGLK